MTRFDGSACSWGSTAEGTSPPIHVFLPPSHGHGGAFGEVVEPGYASDQASSQAGHHADHGVFHEEVTLPPIPINAICGNVTKQ